MESGEPLLIIRGASVFSAAIAIFTGFRIENIRIQKRRHYQN